MVVMVHGLDRYQFLKNRPDFARRQRV